MHDSLTEIQSVGDQLRVAAIKGQIDLFNMLDENRMRLLQKFDSIRIIMYAVLNIIPSIMNIMALFLLALYIFACVGINLFSTIKPRENIVEKNNF